MIKWLKFETNNFNGSPQKVDLNIKLDQETLCFLSPKKAHNSCKIPARVMTLVLHGQVMMVNKCCKFESNSFDQLGEKWT